MIQTKAALPVNHTAGELSALAKDIILRYAGKYGVDPEKVSFDLLRRETDLSDRAHPKFRYTLGYSLEPDVEERLCRLKKHFSYAEECSLNIKKISPRLRPVVIGAGPAGLFAALTLAKAGACPVVLERGRPVDDRAKDIASFFSGGLPDPESNIQFGEGGAGAFSDGKLKYGKRDPYNSEVLRELTEAGAPCDIAYSTSAHIGTDRLPGVVKNLRKKIEALGGSFIFSARVTGFYTGKDNEIRGVYYEKNGLREFLECDKLLLAVGHSARDTFAVLKNSGALLVPKGIGIGVRIEHPQSLINGIIYGGERPPFPLGAASYRLVTHLESGRSVYTFCMCPGGSVVAATSGGGGIVTNGMSRYARDGANANAAYLVSVSPDDYGSSDPLAGFEFQRRVEERAFALSGSYSAPVCTLAEFLGGTAAHSALLPTYPAGTFHALPEEYLPEFAVDSLRAAFPDFEKRMPGITLPGALITGPETRSTCPVRVMRDSLRRSVGIPGLFPCGEGSGDAGGIVSSAADGVKSALSVIELCSGE